MSFVVTFPLMASLSTVYVLVVLLDCNVNNSGLVDLWIVM